MVSFIFALILVLISFLSLTLVKAYKHLPVKEVKLLARNDDEHYKLLYRVIAYGSSLYTFLYLVSVLSMAGGIILLAILPEWFAFIASVLIIWAAFLWLPAAKLSSISERLTTYLSPLISWVLRYLYKPLGILSHIMPESYRDNFHAGIYDKTDLVGLMEWQKDQPHNRIPAYELTIAQNALEFGDKKISDNLITKRQVQSVLATELIGPILMGELHDSGHSKFPVLDRKNGEVIGILYMRDVIKTKSGGYIRDIMKEGVSYVHEDFSLGQVFQAFLKTQQHMFIVINSSEDFVGIITIEDVLSQVVSHIGDDQFEDYDNAAAVAAINMSEIATENEKVTPEVSEVVE